MAALAVGMLAACAATLRPPAVPMSLHAATYNLRLDTAADGPDAWPHRRAAVQALLRRHDLDIVGTQEGLPHQIDDLASVPGYAFVGVGRDDGVRGGEHSAILYRADRFVLLARGDFWLSPTPEQPSKGWDARCCHRLASWARLRHRATEREIFVLSTHFDHEGTVARRESARLVLDRIRVLAGPLPVLVMGDLNATPQSEPVSLMRHELSDAREVAETAPMGPLGTFNGFNPRSPLIDRIDYLFTSRHWRVLTYAALDDRRDDGRYPSDHLPVVVRLLLP